MSSSDDALIERVRQRDSEALVEFIESRRRQLLSFIDRNLSDGLKRKVEPQDVLQEVAVSALGGLQDMDLSERDPFSWLCQLAERRIIDAHRKYFGAQKRSAEREVSLGSPATASRAGGFVEFLAASMTTPSQALSRNQREFKLMAALETLPEDNREALRMRYVENLPSKEIAQRLGKTDGAVRVLLSRSLGKLQELLSKDTAFQGSTWLK
ncbi:MAG: RNA polymerase sigma factor [Planctomycetaceae bacterium]